MSVMPSIEQHWMKQNIYKAQGWGRSRWRLNKTVTSTKYSGLNLNVETLGTIKRKKSKQEEQEVGWKMEAEVNRESYNEQSDKWWPSAKPRQKKGAKEMGLGFLRSILDYPPLHPHRPPSLVTTLPKRAIDYREVSTGEPGRARKGARFVSALKVSESFGAKSTNNY